MSWGMLRNHHLKRQADRIPVAVVLSLALMASACSGGLGLGTPSATTTDAAPPPAAPVAAPPSNPSFKDKISSFFSGSSASSPQQVAGVQEVLDCPLIDIRQGASTLTIGPSGTTAGGDSTNNGAMAVKYQGTFVRAARECTAVAGQLVMKVGVQGRIIVGPAGGPGQVDVPLRIAIVDETPAGTKPIVTKFIRIPVTVASATDNPTFTHVEEGMSFPMPRDLDNYIVYIGFDPLALQAQDHPAPKPKPAVKPKVKPPARTG
jgi:hypothetical protein